MERKIGSGRKGTVDEEEYLLKSISKLVEKFAVTKGEVRCLLPHLLQFTDKHRKEGLELQREVGEFEREIQDDLDEIWARPMSAEGGEEPEPIGWAARIAEIEKSKSINPLDKVPKPDLSQTKDWGVKLLDHK
jgi:elongator complex protein 1